MITRRTIFALPIAIGMLSASPLAVAHRAALGETTITSRGDRLEIIHVFHLDDVQRALFKGGLIEKPDLRSLRDRARLALYVDETFDLMDGHTALELDLIGAEVVGRTAYVYQEYTRPVTLNSLSVRADMFRDLIPGQRNRIDLDVGGQTRSLEFKGNDTTKKVLA